MNQIAVLTFLLTVSGSLACSCVFEPLLDRLCSAQYAGALKAIEHKVEQNGTEYYVVERVKPGKYATTNDKVEKAYSVTHPLLSCQGPPLTVGQTYLITGTFMDAARTVIDYTTCKETILWSVFETYQEYNQFPKACKSYRRRRRAVFRKLLRR